MNVVITLQDLTALPTAMLASTKAHMRISTTDEDALITDKIGMAIDRLQTDNGFRIVPSTYDWTPSQAEFCNGAVPVPYPPVRTLTITGADPAAYSLEFRSIDGAPIVYVLGAYVTGLKFTITTGFLTPADLPPDLRSRIQQLTAHLFEHREILAPNQPFVLPDLAQSQVWWMPRI